MQYLGLLGTLVVLFLNLWGLALLSGLIIKDRWLAFVGGPWLFATAMFSVESYVGLGDLRIFGTLTSVLSLFAIWLSSNDRWLARLRPRWQGRAADWQNAFRPSRLVAPGVVFLLIFGYAFAWRFAFPDVDGSSEKIADLSYICSYLTGAKIPVPDAWLYPYSSTQYYSFQHYAAALMGRMMGLSPGAVYNIAFCLLIGFVGTTFTAGVWLVTTKPWVRLIVCLSFMIGGTGATLATHLTDNEVRPWSAMRYVGTAPCDRAPFGPMLKRYMDSFPKMDLPGEPFSYSIYLGDYHAPLAGYYLMTLAVLAGTLWQQTKRMRYVAIVGATFVWTLLSNSWSLPLQVIGVAIWLLANRRDIWRMLPWLIGGAAKVWFLASVYLGYFTAASSEYKTSIKLVAWADHTPPLLFVIFLFPTICLALTAFYSRSKLGIWLAVGCSLLLVISEMFFVDDVYSGMYERFNTTLKWWPWIAGATLMTIAPVLLEQSPRKWVKIVGLVCCVYPCLYIYDLGRFWVNPEKPALGKIDGTYFLTKDLMNRLMLGRMKQEPHGIVIERPTKDGFTNSACLPLFAGHRMWLGWVGHEQLWHGYRDDLPQRQEKLFQLFNGEMKDAGRWAKGQGIDYILWYQPDDNPERWDKVDASVGPEGIWCEVYASPEGRKVGFWRISR